MGKVSIPKPKTAFLKVKCSSCGNEQIIFNSPSKDVKCLACNNILAESTGGTLKLKAKIIKDP